MKKSVILLILLIILMPISYAYEEKTYIYGDGLIASKDDNNQITYYHQDFLGSNRFTANMQGELIGKSVQEPYGSELSEKGTREGLSNDYKFTGKEKDNSLYYYGARYYEPSSGRFISVDPVFSPSISSYAYANDNPLKYVDPSGMILEISSQMWNRQGMEEEPTWRPVVSRWVTGWSIIGGSAERDVTRVGGVFDSSDGEHYIFEFGEYERLIPPKLSEEDITYIEILTWDYMKRRIDKIIPRQRIVDIQFIYIPEAPLDILDVDTYEDLMRAAEYFREEYELDITMASGFRTWSHQLELMKKNPEASEFSMHLDGRAVDLHIESSNKKREFPSREEIYEEMKRFGFVNPWYEEGRPVPSGETWHFEQKRVVPLW